MATLSFASASSQYIGFTTLLNTLASLITAPHTLVSLSRQTGATGNWRQMCTVCNSARDQAFASVGYTSANLMTYDATRGGPTGAGAFTDTTNWYWHAIGVATPDTPDTTMWRRNHTAAGAWSGLTVSTGDVGYLAAQPGSTGRVQIGRWLTSDYWQGQIAVVALYDRRLTLTELNEITANDRTSDLWNASGGAPVFLVEFNVAATSVVDLAGNATRDASVSAPTLTGPDPDRWTFDNTGAVPPEPSNTGYGLGTYGGGTYGIRAAEASTPQTATEAYLLSEGAVILNVSTSRTETMTASEAVAMANSLIASDSATQSDPSPALLTTLALAAVDSFSLSDAAALTATLALAGSDSTAMTDAVSTLSSALAASETYTVSEALQLLQTLALTAVDSTAFTEAALKNTIDAITASDSATQSEAAASLLTTLAVIASDSATQSEAIALAMMFVATDSAILAEAAAMLSQDSILASDNVALTEASALLTTLALGADDALTLSEISTLANALEAAPDTAALTEAAVFAASLSALDSQVLTDAASILETLALSVTDTATQSDASALLTALAISVSEAATLSDLAQIAASMSQTDIATLSDAGLLSAAIDALETHNLTEAASILETLALAASEALVLSEVASLFQGLALQATDTLTVSDMATYAATLQATESSAFSDSSALAAQFARVDSWVLSSETSEAVQTLQAAASDALVQSEAATAQQTDTRAVTDTMTFADAAINAANMSRADAATLAELADAVRTDFIASSDSYVFAETVEIATALIANDLATLTDLGIVNAFVVKTAFDELFFGDLASVLYAQAGPPIRYPTAAAIAVVATMVALEQYNAVAVVQALAASAALTDKIESSVNVQADTTAAVIEPYETGVSLG